MTVDISTIGIEFKTDGLDKGTAALGKTTAAANKTADAVDKVGKTGKSGMSELERATKTAERQMSSASATAQTFTRTLGVGLAAAAVGAVAVVAAITAVARPLFDASVAAERLKIGLDFASGGNGAKELRFVTDLSNRLGLSLQSTASAFTGFSAAARGTALQGEATRSIFEAVSKASAVMGLSSEQSTGALLALQQMISKGTVQAEELRGQLGERLPGAFQIAARSMGVTTQELGKMLEQGQVLADDFLPKFAAQLEKEIGGAAEKAANRLGAAEKAANRLGAATNRMETSLFRLKVALGDSGISALFAGGLTNVSRVFDTFSGFIEKFNTQGGLREAASDVLRLSNSQAILKRGFESGVGGSIFKADLDLVTAQLEAAKQKFRQLDAASRNASLPDDVRSNFPSRGSRAPFETAQAKALKQAESGLSDVRKRISGINKSYLEDLKKYEDALKAGVITQQDYIKEVGELAKKTFDASATGKEANKTIKEGESEVKKALDTYNNLMQSISEKTASQTLELQTQGALTDSQKFAIKTMDDLRTGTLKLTDAQKIRLSGSLELLLIADAEIKTAEEMSKANIAASEAHLKYVDSLVSGLDNLQQEVAAQKEYNDRLGLGKEAIAALDAIKLESQATTVELMAIKMLDKNLDEAQYNLYKAQADELRKLANLKRTGASKSTALDEEAEIKKNSQAFADELHGDLKGALSAAFRDTKNHIKAFGDALANTVFTRVSSSLADALVKGALSSSFGSGLLGILGFGGAAAGGGSAAAALVGGIAPLASGGAFDNAGAKFFANGGEFHNSVLTQATPFKFASGGSFAQGVAGEAGPEAVMPLTRAPDGRLGVQSSGQAKTVQNVTVNYNMTVGDVASVSMVRQAVAGSERRIAAGIGRSLSYGGALS